MESIQIRDQGWKKFGSGIRDGKNSDPGSGINIPDQQHCFQGMCPCDCGGAEPACPDLHPILYWNLVYLFHRIAAPSHLPGLLLHTPSLALLSPPPHPSWRGANHTTVKVRVADPYL
jgi:hypothetical protein